MTADERGFMARILAEPDDNTHRLVYADWLDECGTTDQQRARSEWVRLTCWDRSKRTSLPTGDRTRLAGEPAWLLANAHRLWPHLFAVGAVAGRRTRISLATGRIDLRVSLKVPDAGRPSRVEGTLVRIVAERGVTRSVGVTFLRGAWIAPAAAADEPAALVAFQFLPGRIYDSTIRSVYVLRRPFALRQLGGVWERIAGGEDRVDRDRAKVIPMADGPFPAAEAGRRIDAALTEWARAESANPLVTGAEGDAA